MRRGYERGVRGADAHDADFHDADFHDDWDDAPPRRRGVVARAVSWVKLALFLMPIALFAASYFVTDCGARSGSGIGQLFRAGACARNEMLSGAASLPDNLAILRRAMN